MAQERFNMDTIPLRWGHIRVLATASMEQLTGGALTTLVGIVIPMLQLTLHTPLGAVAQGVLAAMSLVGIMIGSILIGQWSDRHGYLFFFRLGPALILAGAITAWLLPRVDILAISFFVMGFGVGGGYSLDSDYISQIMPARWRLVMVGVAKATSAPGNIIAAVAALLLLRGWYNPANWNFLLLVIAALAAVMLLSRLRFAQSPAWLMAHGRAEEAARAAHFFLGEGVELNAKPQSPHPAHRSSISHHLRSGNLRRTIFCGLPWACEGLGVYGIGVFLPVLVMSLGLGEGTHDSLASITASVRVTVWISLAILPGFVAGLAVVNRWWHVRTQTIGFLGAAAGLAILIAAWQFHLPVWLSIVGFIIFELFLNAGPHLMTFILPSEIYSVEERGTGAGLAAACGKAGAVAGVAIIPPLMSWGGAVAALGVTFIAMVAGAVITAVVGRRVLPNRSAPKAGDR